MAALAGLPILAGSPAAANDAGSSVDVLTEVVVTAQRREQDLQMVPISVSVLSTQELEQLQISDLAQLQYAVPNLSIAPGQTTEASASIAMRGQYESDTTPTVDPAVGLYLDGVYFARITGANLDLIDMQRVEVLHGPQGTLFGRNTIGGAINLVPNRPAPEFSGAISAAAGDYDHHKFTAIVNAPLYGGSVLSRLTAMHSELGGYAYDPLLNRQLARDRTDFARLQLQFNPASQAQVLLAADYSSSESGSPIRTLLAVDPGSESVPATLGNPGDSLINYIDPYGARVSANQAGTVRSTVWGTSATLTIDLAPLTFKAITAYRALDSNASDSDQDGTPYELGVILLRSDAQHQFSQELQLFGSAPGKRLDWIVGLLFFDEGAMFQQSNLAFVPATRTFNENIPWGDASNQSRAAYAQISFALTPRLKLTAGARYNQDRRQLTSHNARQVSGAETCRIAPQLLDEPGVCVATRPVRTFSYVPFTAGIEFSPGKPALLYAKLSRGYRAGGYNIRGTDEVDMNTFDPEHVDSYEVGAKTNLLRDRLHVNLAVFHSRFEDMQLVQRASAIGLVAAPRFIQNGGTAKLDGGELQIGALLNKLRLTANLGVTHARFTRLDPRVDGVTLDSKFMLTPKSTVAIAADLPIATGFGVLALHADYSWRDTVWFAYDRASAARQDANGLLGASLTASFDRSRLQISFWGRNLAQQGYATRVWYNGFYFSAAPGNPRTFGITLSHQFGGSSSGRRLRRVDEVSGPEH